MKASGFEIGHYAEVTQGAESSGQTLSKLEQTVNRLDRAIGESSFEEGGNAVPVLSNARCQLAKRVEPTELGPLAPPAQGLLIFVGEDVLEHVAQTNGATELGVAIAQRAPLLALLIVTGPFIATQRPERPLQVGSLASQFLTDLLESLASHLHEMKTIEDDLGSGKEPARSTLISWTHIHTDKFDLLGLSPVGYQCLGKGFQSLGAAAFDRQEKIMGFSSSTLVT